MDSEEYEEQGNYCMICKEQECLCVVTEEGMEHNSDHDDFSKDDDLQEITIRFHGERREQGRCGDCGHRGSVRSLCKRCSSLGVRYYSFYGWCDNCEREGEIGHTA